MLQLATFPEAPLRSRTVGFPESGLASVLHAISQGGLPPRRETAVLAHPSPRRGGVCIAPSPRRRPRETQRCVWCLPTVVATECPEPLCPERALPAPGRPREPPGGALPPRRRSYGLMRQTISLPAPRLTLVRGVFPVCRQSLLGDGPSRHYLRDPRVGARTFTPPRSRLHMSAPSPGTPVSPHGRRVRRARLSPHGNVGGEPNLEAAVIRSPSGSYACSAPRLLPPRQHGCCRAAGPFTPRTARPVTRTGMWRRYMLDTDD